MNNAEKLLYKYYLEDNCEIVNLNNKHKNTCYIFFSSNGLYKDRNDVDVIRKMHDTKRYEWKFIASNEKIKRNASKIIYLRDIFKIFYIRGINKTINSVDKIKTFLEKETAGMDVVLAGSSAGAYIALLLGNMLNNTKRIIALGGVVDLESFRTFSSYLDENLQYCSYINISERLSGDYWIINFYGAINEYDKHSAELIDKYSNLNKLINIGFNDDTHAPRPSGDDLIKLLTCSENHLKKVKTKNSLKHITSANSFSITNLGLFKSTYNSLKSFLVKQLRKGNEKNN